jgi:pilus assembly protein CpaB
MKTARLVVLGIAVVAGGGAALLAGRSDAPAPAPAPVVAIDTVEILVAKRDINIGQSIQAADMGWVAWPAESASSQFVRRADHADAIEQLTGAIARTPIATDEPLRESKLIKTRGSGYMAAILPAGMRAVSTEISPETGAGGFILPNDRVDVILSRRDKEAERLTGVETMVGETLLSDVQVLAIDQNVEEKNGQRVVVGKTATLELTQRQAETLAMGRLMGSLSLALRSLVDRSKGGVDVPADEVPSNRVNMVRFGVSTTAITK